MWDALFASLSLLNVSGVLIIAATVGLLVAGIAVTLLSAGRYARIARDLRRNADTGSFDSRVLNEIVREALDAARMAREVNTQAIIDHQFQSTLRGMLMGERFVKATTGLMIILGLVGTFYGLTMSIGKLVALISGEVGDASAITQSLMGGLTQALAGMSVAFLTSLFGILSAIVMTLLGVFVSLPDRRTALMVQIEAHLDHVLLATREGLPGVQGGSRLEQVLSSFGQSVHHLDAVVGRFEAALVNFAGTTRDFHEFNLHLKDNVQRMSLSFGDLSETVKQHVSVLRSRDGR